MTKFKLWLESTKFLVTVYELLKKIDKSSAKYAQVKRIVQAANRREMRRQKIWAESILKPIYKRALDNVSKEL